MVDSDRIRSFFGVTDCNAPAVSPSGDAVAYRSEGGRGTELRLRSVASGEDRRLAGDLPPVNRTPLYWLPDGGRLVSVAGTEGEHAIELVSRTGERELLVELDERAFLYDAEPGVVWYWTVEGVHGTLYRHPSTAIGAPSRRSTTWKTRSAGSAVPRYSSTDAGTANSRRTCWT